MQVQFRILDDNQIAAHNKACAAMKIREYVQNPPKTTQPYLAAMSFFNAWKEQDWSTVLRYSQPHWIKCTVLARTTHVHVICKESAAILEKRLGGACTFNGYALQDWKEGPFSPYSLLVTAELHDVYIGAMHHDVAYTTAHVQFEMGRWTVNPSGVMNITVPEGDADDSKYRAHI